MSDGEDRGARQSRIHTLAVRGGIWTVIAPPAAATGSPAGNAARYLPSAATDTSRGASEALKALAVGRRLARIANGRVTPVLAQYCCELAERALAAGDVGPAQRHIDDALALQPECIRAALLSGRLARQAGRDRDAISAWRRAVQQEPAMLDETIDDIVAAFQRVGDEAGLRDFLAVATRQRVGLRTLQVVVDAIRRRDGDEAAEAFLVERLGSLPSVPGLKTLIDLQRTNPAQPPRTIWHLRGTARGPQHEPEHQR